MVNMVKRLLLVLFTLGGLNIQSQTDSLSAESKPSFHEELPPALGEAFRPTIGLGTGMLSFWGDVNKGRAQAPWNAKSAFDLSVSQPLNKYLYE